MSTEEFSPAHPGQNQGEDNNIAVFMANNIISDAEMQEEQPTGLKDFHMYELLQIIEDAINSEEYEIEHLIAKIYEF